MRDMACQLLAIGTLLLSPWTVVAAEHTTDSLETVKERLQSKQAILLDVREPVEWEQGHLKQASPLALSKLRKGVPADELKKLLAGDRIIYAHCFAGVRCLEAAERLKTLGYDVRPLKPGYKDLVNAGFETAKD